MSELIDSNTTRVAVAGYWGDDGNPKIGMCIEPPLTASEIAELNHRYLLPAQVHQDTGNGCSTLELDQDYGGGRLLRDAQAIGELLCEARKHRLTLHKIIWHHAFKKPEGEEFFTHSETVTIGKGRLTNT